MKRLISMILCMAIVLGLAMPVSAQEELSLVIDAEELVLASPSEAYASGAAKRSELADNIVFPGPITENSCMPKGYRASLYFVQLRTGKANQYACVLIYAGKELTGDPVYTGYWPFSTEEGIAEYKFYWDCSNLATGEYTVVSLTANLQGDTLYPIDGTAFGTNVYITDGWASSSDYFLMDWETGVALNQVNLSVNEVGQLAWSRTTTYTTRSRILDYVYVTNGLADVIEAAGAIYIFPKRCGSGELVLRYNSGMYFFPIHICTTSSGHNYAETVVARETTVDESGVTVHFCDVCNSVIREESESYEIIFSRFGDVPETEWFYPYVKQAVYQNLFNGVSLYSFQPNQAMTRAMLVTVLWRYEGEPTAAEHGFTDVSRGSWYDKAVAWAAEQNIVNGVGNGKFNPDGEVTREQMATILYRYAQMRGFETEPCQSMGDFVDVADLSPWAEDAMSWAVESGMIAGSMAEDQLYLLPKDNATRAQVAAVLIRFIEKFDPQPTVTAETLDLTTAIDSGSYDTLQWAYYPEGVLRIAGTGEITVETAAQWEEYKLGIKTIEILSSINSIEDETFKGYKTLQSVWIADSLEYIGNSVFENCISLTEIRLPQNGFKFVGNQTFKNCSSLEYIELPQGTISIGYRAFENCVSLREIELPDTITEHLGAGLFYGCRALERAKLPIAVIDLPNHLFYGCSNLKEVVIPACAQKMGRGIFYGCTSLESFIFSSEIRTIYNGMFTDCTNLKNVYVLNPTMHNYKNDWVLYPELNDLPFGDPEKVTVYGIAGSSAQSLSEEYGYTFVDLVNP